MTFSDFLESRSIDCQELAPELLTALQSQYAAEYPPEPPQADILIVPSECQWPARGFWTVASQ